MQKKRLIVIAGPTAVGKTSIAIQLAHHLCTVIVSADSRQVYKEMNIGVARPSIEQLADIKHYCIASHSIIAPLDVALYEEQTIALLDQLFLTYDNILLVGGTGLYIHSIVHGMDSIPDVPNSIRAEVEDNYKEKGIVYLTDFLEKHSPESLNYIDKHNPRRLIRAVEVFMATGMPLHTYQHNLRKKRNFKVEKFLLYTDKVILEQNINNRVDEMITQGWISEVESLLPYRNSRALDTVGYKEIFDYLEGKLILENCIELIKIKTRQYAKRQMTWFSKDNEYHHIYSDSNALDNIFKILKYNIL